MKRITILLLILLCGHYCATAQTDTLAYGVEKNMPL